MKFHQLAVGDRFRFNGVTFTKAGPVTANRDDGGPQMIPRSADVEPMREAAPSTTGSDAATARVMREFDAFYAECAKLVAGLAKPENRDDAVAALESARQRFIANIRK